jgi:hypothetical protein
MRRRLGKRGGAPISSEHDFQEPLFCGNFRSLQSSVFAEHPTWQTETVAFALGRDGQYETLVKLNGTMKNIRMNSYN